MSLQVWLPLDGNLNLLGIFNVPSFTVGSGITISNNGIIGKCYSFNGTQSSHIRFNNGNISLTTELTVAFWVKLNVVSPAPVYFDFATGADLWLFVLSGNTINTRDSASGQSGTRKNYTLSFSPVVDTWYHLALTWDSGEIKFYLNGTLTNTVGSKITNLHLNNITDLTFGTGWSSSNNALNGYMNDIRIYNNVLSAEEIKKISLGLLLHYPLNSAPFSSFDNLNLCLPDEYQRVEYLESTGENLYIDTGFYLEDVDAYFIDAWIINKGSCGGYRGGDSTGSCYLPYLLNNTNIKTKTKLNVPAEVSYQTYGHTYTLTLFGLRAFNDNSVLSSEQIMRLYNYKFYKNDICVANFIPCYRKSDLRTGMYDIVNNVFHDNSRDSKEFIIGPILKNLSSEYNELEYLAANEAPFIDTGVIYKIKPRIDTEIYLTSTADRDIMGTSAANSTCFIVDYANTICYSRYGVSSYTSYTNSVPLLTWIPVSYSNNWIENGIIKKTWTSYDFSSNTALIYLFKARGSGSVRMKKVLIYDNNILLRNLVPALRKSDSKLGMYDILNDIFYINNASSGADFTGELKFIDTIEYDISGFHNDGIINSINIIDNTIRYNYLNYFDTVLKYLKRISPFGEVKTICFWAKVPSSWPSGYLAYFADFKSYAACGAGSNAICPRSRNNGNLYAVPSNLKLNDWNWFCLIYNNDKTIKSVYVNNVAATVAGSQNYYTHSTDELVINNRNNGSYVSGMCQAITDFRMYATELSEDDRTALYNMGRLS